MNTTTPTPSGASSNWKYATFFLAGVVIAAIAILIFNQGNITGNAVQNPTAPIAEVSVDDDAVLGAKDAPVTIVEFSDYQCPFCRKFWTETYPQLKQEYVDTGKAKIIFRDFPLTSIHPSAQIASEAAECVRAQGGDAAYWRMHDKMFQEQNIMDSGSATGSVTKTVTFTDAELKTWAKALGFDIASCLDSHQFASEVQEDMTDGQSYGVRGTPAFFVNGKLLSGAQPFSAFKAAIDAELR
jgi:protein-disulfide isomerase